ncbi:NUDIX domain-containing protein [Vibrio sp. S4M6]|uniref:NUDIX domain-containing protein n=1 Tax=Vibrio sinus TaxID=2946865 RepID=UPI002029DD3D|nr:NUDIX domain-containing protein [Vibrio sinus]MCL9782652.1 NUDIX domain-containing protein [Vibrio sinus]
MQHRIRAAGVLISGEKILLLKVCDHSGEYWILPGGGLEKGDRSTKQALQREFEEETGLSVKVGELICVSEFVETKAGRYNAQFFYHICRYSGEPHLENLVGLNDEDFIKAVEWVAVDQLTHLRLYPKGLDTTVMDILKEQNFSTHLGCYIQGENDEVNYL